MPARFVKATLARAPWILAVAALAAIGSLPRSGGAETSPAGSSASGDARLDALAGSLSEASGARASPADIVWEPSRGTLVDAVVGRRLVFLAANGPSEPKTRDVFRARVLVGRSGAVTTVLEVANLTRTPLADEGPLVDNGLAVGFISARGRAATGVTVLDFRAAARHAASMSARLGSLVDGALGARRLQGGVRVEVALASGFTDAVLAPERQHFRLTAGARSLALDLDRLGDERQSSRAWPSAYVVDTWRGPLTPRDGPPRLVRQSGMRADVQSDMKSGMHAGAQSDMQSGMRASVQSGMHAGAQSDMQSGMRASVQSGMRAGRHLARTLRSEALRLAGWAAGSCEPNPAAVEARSAAEPARGKAPWPKPEWPQPVVPACAQALPGEGEWRPLGGAQASELQGLYETELGPDPSRPRERVRLVAIDTRALELRYVPGSAAPHALTGPGASGTLSIEDSRRLVASFAGAHREGEAPSGVVVDGRELVPPIADTTAVGLDRAGRARLGPWPHGTSVPREIATLRQGLTTLLEAGRPAATLPGSRPQLAATARVEERAALCRTREGQLVYAWGAAISAASLARALVAAGCEHAVALDPECATSCTHYDACGAPGFASHGAPESKPTLLDERMSANGSAFLGASPAERFVLLRRGESPLTKPALGFSPLDVGTPKEGARPALSRRVGERQGEPITTWAFTGAAYRWTIRTGTRESAGRTTESGLDEREHASALVAIGLGAARIENRRGLVRSGTVIWPVRADFGVLATSAPDGSPSIAIATENLAPEGDASELVLLVDEGKVRREARELGAPRLRTAACLLDDETLLVAEGTTDSLEPQALELMSAGCSRIVALDRGEGAPGFIHRAGTGTPPLAEYRETVLYGFPPSAVGTARGF